MDFKYTDEQRMLAESLRRFVDSEYTFQHRRKLARCGGSFDEKTWNLLAEMGVLGLTVPSEFDGFGESAASQLVVQLELGRGLVLEPVTPSAVMSTSILSQWGSEAQKAEWLPQMSKGQRIVSLAYLETDARFDTQQVSTLAHKTADGYSLSGAKCLVWHGQVADALLVTARVVDSSDLTLFLVPRVAHGVLLASYPTMDGLQAADLTLTSVTLPFDSVVGNVGEGLPALEHGLDWGIAALCAEAAGAMERLIEITGDYLRTRQQFGKPLGVFQALQHRMADMLVQKELALSMAYVAAQALDEPDPGQRRRMLAAAKFMTAKAGRFVGQQAVQLHGGMGITDEMAVGDYFKRLTMIDPLLGDSDYHLQRYCEVLAI